MLFVIRLAFMKDEKTFYLIEAFNHPLLNWYINYFVNVSEEHDCLAHCLYKDDCESVVVDSLGGQVRCYLLNDCYNANPYPLQPSTLRNYYFSKKNKDCVSLMLAGEQSGFHSISPFGEESFNVWCTTKDGWIVLWHTHFRKDMNRSWNDYKNGFHSGDSYWLGNEYIHLLTRDCNYEIKVFIRIHKDGGKPHGIKLFFNKFCVGSSDTNYTITFNDTALADNNVLRRTGLQFSTYDRDNDKSSTNCAHKYNRGWWFDDCASNIELVNVKIRKTC